MEVVIEVFKRRLYEEWLPHFCNDKKREKDGYSSAVFKETSVDEVSGFDAENFMHALDNKLVRDHGGGRYHCKRPDALELGAEVKIFKTDRKPIQVDGKIVEPRLLSLSVEELITIGAIARLVLDYGWSEKSLCMEIREKWPERGTTSPFDFAVFDEVSSGIMCVAGEVKSKEKLLDALVEDLIDFGEAGLTSDSGLAKKEDASYRKWEALLRRKASFFWAVGPNNYTHLYSVKYGADSTAIFTEVHIDKLMARKEG